jgi:hypothetical protein
MTCVQPRSPYTSTALRVNTLDQWERLMEEDCFNQKKLNAFVS